MFGSLLSSVCDEQLEHLRKLNIIGVVLVSAFVIALTFLTLEIIRWLKNLCPPQSNNCGLLACFGFGEKCAGSQECQRNYQACSGQNQSPINIDTKCSTRVEKCDPLQWINYDLTPHNMIITNNGFSVKLTAQWCKGLEPTITGGALGRRKYYFKRVLFRWGSNVQKGSEHTINNINFPFEMQVEHVNCNDPEDIVCISRIFQTSPQDDKVINEIVKGLWEIPSPGTSACIYPMPIERLVCPFNYGYYMYDGSLTYPPFSENVTWIINSNPFCISVSQLLKFSTLYNFDNCPITANNRPLQMINNRPIYYYAPDDDDNIKSCEEVLAEIFGKRADKLVLADKLQ